jgi:hypothetical protein
MLDARWVPLSCFLQLMLKSPFLKKRAWGNCLQAASKEGYA